MMQKYKVFTCKPVPNCFENEKNKLEQEINDFLADGKRVLHMQVSTEIYTNGNLHIIYIVSIVYEDTAEVAIKLLGEEFQELPAEAVPTIEGVDAFLGSLKPTKIPANSPTNLPVAAHWASDDYPDNADNHAA